MPLQGKHLSICIISVLLAACGGDAPSTETGSGGTNPAPAPAPVPSPSPTPNPAPAPALGDIRTSSDGADLGLIGCINSGLYSYGDIVVNLHYQHSTTDPTGVHPTTSQNLSEQTRYTFTRGTFGSAYYDVRRDAASYYDRYRITAKTLIFLGTTFYGPDLTHPVPAKTYYHLRVGQSRVSNQEVYRGPRTATGDPGRDATDWNQIYIGRESITVPAGTFETCRVDLDPVTAFKASWSQIWYAVGSGVIVRSIEYQASSARPIGDQLVLVSEKQLQSGTIGTVQIRP